MRPRGLVMAVALVLLGAPPAPGEDESPRVKFSTSVNYSIGDYVASEITLLAAWLWMAGMDLYCGRRLNAAFCAVNTAFLFYALWRFVGVRSACAGLAPLARSLRQC